MFTTQTHTGTKTHTFTQTNKNLHTLQNILKRTFAFLTIVKDK